MKFIALIIALLCIQYWGSAQRLHRDEWLDTFLNRLRAARLPPGPELALVLLLPTLLFLVLNSGGSWLYGVPALAVNVLVLLYSFGRGDFHGAVAAYRGHCRAGDFEAAFLAGQQQFPRQQAQAADTEDAEHLHRWMKKRLAYMGFERWFAVIFYFVLLGAAGALTYRLSQLLGDRVEQEGAPSSLLRRIRHILDWLPTRLLIFAFALTGDYLDSREQMRSSLQDLETPADQIISDAAHAALSLGPTVFADGGDTGAVARISDREVEQLHGLLGRSAVAWIVVISLLVVFS